LLGARPGETRPRTEIGYRPCEQDAVRFTGLAPGRYRVCTDDLPELEDEIWGDDPPPHPPEPCTDVTLRASPRVQKLHVSP
jgi:hypothetical protein